MNSNTETIRLVSMDGGDGRVTARLLNKLRSGLIAKGYSGDFLDNVNLFAGASAGGINSLLLANEHKPDSIVEQLTQDWDILTSAFFLPPPSDIQKQMEAMGPLGAMLMPMVIAQGLMQFGLGLTGLSSLFTDQYMRDYFSNRFDNETIGSLKHGAAVVSFQLDNEAPNPDKRRWVPRVFTNVNSKDQGVPLVDVALRTSAQPVEMPVFRSTDNTGPGFIDGGYVANNPSMVALARLIHFAEQQSKGQSAEQDLLRGALCAPDDQPMPKVLMLSLGAGVRNFFPQSASYIPQNLIPFNDGAASLGYAFWMLNPMSPLMMLNMFLQSASEEVDVQVKSLIGSDAYWRVDPRVENTRFLNGEQLDAAVQSADQDWVDNTIEWMESSGWLEAPAATKLTISKDPAGSSTEA